MEPVPTERLRCDCGAVLDPTHDWCSQCYQPRVPQPGVPQPRIPPGPAPESRAERQGAPTPDRRRSGGGGRWAATDVTFGLTGRILWTVIVTLPILLFLVVLIPTGLGGIAVYSIVYIPALRQIWRRADRL